MLRFYLLTTYLLLSFIAVNGQTYNFFISKEIDVTNDCLNGGTAATASLMVSGLNNLSNDLELIFAGADFTPKNSFDLKITIISPQGTRAVFFDTRSGSNFPVNLGAYNLFRARNCGWFLPHTSPQLVPWQAGKLFCFRPVTDFSVFKGENPNGEWKFEFCGTNASQIKLGWYMLEFRSLKSVISTPNIVKKPTDCLSADGSITFNFATKCDQGSVYYTIDNQPWQSKALPVDYTLGFVTPITQTITGLRAGKHTIRAMLGDQNGNVYQNTYNEYVFNLEAVTASGDIQVVCAGDLTIGLGTTGVGQVKLIPPTHWDNCGFATSITKITAKFNSGDVNVDLNTQTQGISGTGTLEFVWEITNSKGQKKTCSSFVTTVAGNTKIFTADVCKSPVKVTQCNFNKPLQVIPINISQLQNLGTLNNLDKVEITMKFPGKCTGEAYLIDPVGNTYYLFNAYSFPTYNNSGSMTVEFTTSTDPNIKPHYSTILPSASDKLRKPISNLNKANLRKINPNGNWNLAVCDNASAGFDIECVKFHFNDACTKDQEAPTFTKCPANQIVILNANNTGQFNITEPFSTDNCKVKARNVDITYLDGAKDSQGRTTINYTGIDADQGATYGYDVLGKGRIIFKYTTIDDANNEGYCFVYIYAVGPNDCATDQIKPAIVGCVTDFDITAYPSGVTDFVMTDPAFYDNCGIKSTQLNISYLNGAKSIKNTTTETFNTISPYNDYTYQVIGSGNVQFEYLVTDLKGNVGSCKTLVTIKPANTVNPSQVTCGMPQTCIAPGQTVSIPFSVNNFKDIAAFSFDLYLPSNSNLKFEKIDNIGLAGVNYNILSNGDLRIGWDDPNASVQSVPDGTRIFDVVLTATGSFNAPVTINGKDVLIFYGSSTGTGTVSATLICLSTKTNLAGSILSPLNKGIANVKVDLFNGTSLESSSTTNSNGIFSINQASPNTRIKPNRNDNPSAGINVVDVAKIRRHVLQTQLLDTDYKIFAADVDKNSAINIVDVAYVNRIFLQKISEFPNGVPSWRFIPKTFDISGNPLAANIPDYIDWNSSNAANINFIGIKVGDVDFSASVKPDNIFSRSAPIEISIPDTIASKGESMVIPVNIAGGQDISIFSMNILFDSALVHLTKVESPILTGFSAGNYNNLGEKVLIAWDHPQGTSVKANGQVLKLTFDVVGSTGTSEINMEDVIAYDVDFNQFETNLDQGSIQIMPSATNNTDNNVAVSVFPNPTSNIANVSVQLDAPDAVSLELFDATGKLVHTQLADNKAMQHIFKLDLTQLQGVLNMRIKGKNFVTTRILIKI